MPTNKYAYNQGLYRQINLRTKTNNFALNSCIPWSCFGVNNQSLQHLFSHSSAVSNWGRSQETKGSYQQVLGRSAALIIISSSNFLDNTLLCSVSSHIYLNWHVGVVTCSRHAVTWLRGSLHVLRTFDLKTMTFRQYNCCSSQSVAILQKANQQCQTNWR